MMADRTGWLSIKYDEGEHWRIEYLDAEGRVISITSCMSAGQVLAQVEGIIRDLQQKQTS